MTFEIGWDFAEVQILKNVRLLQNDINLSSVEALPNAKFWNKWRWHYRLNWVEYIDRLLRKHWYYQDLAQEIVNYHFSSV